ncbi:MBG domain-containing protein [Sphingobacterium sp. UT-1RO-CII-1]|uniref:MBG domain-containing protein n=1 Tax=Sphingobacterium sp. UT-1RO-CII-1 TaxID=2995225 RepID=UPI00227C261D|nr:MBG domain-containing protein [Sphingobacterium sp. UT-1RO-CII-1]MCY4780543.1 MBG domain-containing protein [Sphingobacterium sp. UT-1RO-CII-1]
MKNTIIYTTYLLVVSLFWGTSAYAQWDKFTPSADNIIYVKVNGGFGNDGSSWAKATNSITRALEWAAANNARFSSQTPLKIYVSKGTFVPEGDAFVLVKNVQLYGGFDPDKGITELKHKRIFGKNGTILNGNKIKLHVVISAGDVENAGLDGFSITGGLTYHPYGGSKPVNGENVHNDRGAGMYNVNSSPRLKNVMIYDNETAGYKEETEPWGVGDDTPRGAGMYNENASPQLVNAVLYGNRGGAMVNTRFVPGLIWDPTSNSYNTPVVGGPSTPKLTNVTIANNEAVTGPAIYNFVGSKVEAYNSIIWGNTKPGGTATANVHNAASGSMPVGYDHGNEVIYYNTITQDDGVGKKVDTSPFTNLAQNDFTLPDNSPAVDFGANVYYKNNGGDLEKDQDLAGNSRLGCTYIDAGPYENHTKPRGACLAPAPGPDNSHILYVDQNVKAGNRNGGSWANAVPELADALKWAWDNNEQRGSDKLLIYVAKGTYYPKYSPEDGLSNPADPAKRRDFTFILGNNVELYGGFDPARGITAMEHARIVPTKDDSEVAGTILSGDFKQNDNIGSASIQGAGSISGNDENAYHVVLGAGNMSDRHLVVDGFTITGGNANANNKPIKIAGQDVERNQGAGISFQHSRQNSYTLRNLAVIHHSSTGDGAGIYVRITDEVNPSKAMLHNSIVYNNSSKGSGGGLAGGIIELNGSLVHNNSSNSQGGGVFACVAAKLDNSLVYSNRAQQNGGGISVRSVEGVKTSAILINSKVNKNYSGSHGGGISTTNSNQLEGRVSEDAPVTRYTSTGVVLDRSNVDDNNSRLRGGGIHAANSFVKSHSTLYVTLSHSTINGNTTAGRGGGIALFSDLMNSNTIGETDNMGLVSLSNSSVNNNKSIGAGAAIDVNLAYKSVYANSPANPTYKANILLSNSSVNNNTAENGSVFHTDATNEKLDSEREHKLISLNSNIIGNKGKHLINIEDNDRKTNLQKKVQLFNSIVYNNNNSDGVPYTDADWFSGVNRDEDNVSFKNSLLQGDPDQDLENANLVGVTDPLFVDAANGDYNLQAVSPLIDAGDRSLYHYSTLYHYYDKEYLNPMFNLYLDLELDLADNKDLAGEPRLSGCNIDIGAFENQSNQGAICITPSADNIVYVNQKVARGDKSGNSWANAVPDLADALKWTHDNRERWSAAKPLKIYVAKGTYHPNYSYEDDLADPKNPTDSRDKTFLMVQNVELYGGFDGQEADLSERTLPTDGATGTILSGDFNGDDAVSGSGSTLKISNNSENAYHVVTAVNGEEDIKLLIDGFEIKGGNADGEESISVKSSGGFSSVSQGQGGGIYMATYGAITLDLMNSRVSGNRAADDGGGIYLLPNAPFPGSDAPNSTIIFDNAHVVANYSGNSGGGLYHRSYINAASNSKSITSDLTLDRSTVRDNYSASFGGGVYTDAVSYGSGSVDVNTLINHSRIEGNWADNSGGGILVNSSKALSIEANNTQFSANGTKEAGAAINAIAPSSTSDNNSITLNNSTVVGNIGKTYINFAGGKRVFKVNNSLILANTKTDNTSSTLGGTPTKTMQYSLVQGETSTADGNINATDVTAGDIFTDAAADDYSLKLGAVAIGTGNNDLYSVGDIQTDTDLAGNPRLFGVTIDMGAYEFQQEVAQEITAAAIRKIYGDADFEPGATVDSEKPLSYTTADNSIAEVYQDVNDGNKWKIKVKKASTVTITASQAGGYGYLPASKDFDLTIAPKPVTVSVRPTAAVNKVYDGTDLGVIAASDLSFADDDILDDDEVTLVLSNTAVRYATKVVGAGKIFTLDLSHLTLEGADKANYVIGNTLALKANIGVVTPAALKVTARADTKDYDGVAYSGGNSVDYEGFVDGETEALLDGRLSYTGDSQGAIDAGTYSILPKGLLSRNYSITYTAGVLTIDKIGLPVFRFEGDTFEYDGSAHSLTAYGLPDGAKVDHYIDNGQTEAGTYTVTAVIDGGINYINGSQVAELTITKAALPALTFMDASFVYDGTAKSLVIGGTLPDGASVSYSNNKHSEAGEYTVTAIVDGGNNYHDSILTAQLRIEPAAIAGITFDDTHLVYDGTAKSLAIEGTLPDGASVSYSNNKHSEAGEYTVTAMVDGGNNYHDSILTAQLRIDPAAIAGITFDDAHLVYDGTAKSLAIGGTLPDGTFVSYSNNKHSEVGEYTVTATIAGGHNYHDSILTAKLRIDPATIAGITFGDTHLVYDGTAKSLAIEGTLPDGASVSYSNNKHSEAGEYTVTAMIDGGKNYQDSILTAKLRIEPATIAGITFGNAHFVYDGTAKSLAIEGTLPDGVSVSYSNNKQSEAGEYTVTAMIDGGKNYQDSILTAKLRIEPATIAGITFGDAHFVYDGTAKSLAIEGTLPDGVSVSYSNNKQSEAGEYTVTATIAGGINYISGSQVAKLTITKAALPALTFMDGSFVYDGSVKALKVIGLPEGTHVDYRENGKTEAGEYTVTAMIDGGNNYQDSILTAQLRIEPATIAGITFGDAHFVYDGTAKSLAIEGTLPDGVSVSYSNNKQSEAGEYTVTATIAGGINYISGSQVAKLTITKAALPALTFMDGAFVYDGSVKALKVIGLPEGTYVDYRENGKTEAGEYTVTAMIDGGNNYQDSILTAKLRIEKAVSFLQFAEITPVSRDVGSLQLDIQSNNPLPIRLYSDNDLVAIVTAGQEVEVLGVGVTMVRAEQDGDANYHAADPVIRELRVLNDKEAKLPVRVHPAVSPNGDGINEFLRIEGIEQYPENKFVVFDANGAVIQSFEGYDNATIIFDGTKAGRPVPNGTYFYVLEVKINGKWLYDKGYFVVRK